MKKISPYVVLIVVAALVYFFKQYTNTGNTKNTTNNSNTTHQTNNTNTTNTDPSSNQDRKDGLDRRATQLQYSNHAKCRMQCRHISQEEVEDVLRNGEINYKKSDLQNPRCPRYAVEEVTKDNQRVRIVFAQCSDYIEVVTVIDLDTDWTCDCPGDEEKNKNRN